jgi:uncharacterized membrane protein
MLGEPFSAVRPNGHPFHPLLVPLPVGAFVSSLIFDILTRTGRAACRIWSMARSGSSAST